MLVTLVTNEEKNFPGFRAFYSQIPAKIEGKSLMRYNLLCRVQSSLFDTLVTGKFTGYKYFLSVMKLHYLKIYFCMKMV